MHVSSLSLEKNISAASVKQFHDCEERTKWAFIIYSLRKIRNEVIKCYLLF